MEQPPQWCNDEALETVRKTFIEYWRPKLEEVVGPEDAGVFVRELDKLISTANANVVHKAEAKAWALRHRVQKALESIGPLYDINDI